MSGISEEAADEIVKSAIEAIDQLCTITFPAIKEHRGALIDLAMAMTSIACGSLGGVLHAQYGMRPTATVRICGKMIDKVKQDMAEMAAEHEQGLHGKCNERTEPDTSEFTGTSEKNLDS